MGFPSGTVLKNLPANAGGTRDTGLISGLGRSPEERNGNPLQYSCLENPMDRRAWPWGCKELDMTELLGTHTYIDKDMNGFLGLWYCSVSRSGFWVPGCVYFVKI